MSTLHCSHNQQFLTAKTWQRVKNKPSGHIYNHWNEKNPSPVGSSASCWSKLYWRPREPSVRSLYLWAQEPYSRKNFESVEFPSELADNMHVVHTTRCVLYFNPWESSPIYYDSTQYWLVVVQYSPDRYQFGNKITNGSNPWLVVCQAAEAK